MAGFADLIPQRQNLRSLRFPSIATTLAALRPSLPMMGMDYKHWKPP
jgi:hypothetical protein